MSDWKVTYQYRTGTRTPEARKLRTSHVNVMADDHDTATRKGMELATTIQGVPGVLHVETRHVGNRQQRIDTAMERIQGVA